MKTQGLIIKEQTIGESDRLVTVLTRDDGILRAFARKAKNLKDTKNSATQLLCYSRLNIYVGREKYIINEAFPIEVFFGLRADISRLALAQYFCELAMELIPEGVDSADYLRIILNALHFLSKGARKELLLKSIVELRLIAQSGFMPNLICCDHCNTYESDEMYFMVHSARLLCGGCYTRTAERVIALAPPVLKAMRHITYSDVERLFSFSLSDKALGTLQTATEEYVQSILQKRLKTLDFYQSVCSE